MAILVFVMAHFYARKRKVTMVHLLTILSLILSSALQGRVKQNLESLKMYIVTGGLRCSTAATQAPSPFTVTCSVDDGRAIAIIAVLLVIY